MKERIKQTKEFLNNYPRLNALFKLFLYFIFFAVFISVIAINKTPNDKIDDSEKVEEVEEKKLTYKEILDNFANKDTYNISLKYTKGEDVTLINANYEDNIMIGTIETTNDLIKFKTDGNSLYEVKMEEEILNNDLLGDIKIEYLFSSKLIEILINEKATKMLEDDSLVYIYNIDNVEYKIKVKDEIINEIIIKRDDINYLITVKE